MGDRVCFRVDCAEERAGEPLDVFALFPDLPGSPGYVTCYAHTGQHSDAHLLLCMAGSRPAEPHEYAALKLEIETLGYELSVL